MFALRRFNVAACSSERAAPAISSVSGVGVLSIVVWNQSSPLLVNAPQRGSGAGHNTMVVLALSRGVGGSRVLVERNRRASSDQNLVSEGALQDTARLTEATPSERRSCGFTS